jgi:hypothetical protein
MALWLFIGTVFGAVLLLAYWRGRSRTGLTHDDQGADLSEHNRRADALAADAARLADARAPPFRGGGLI